jgi:EmrB/QacA subfamily drug resistance transporter
MTKSQKTTAVILIIGAFLSVLNQTLMNPALPRVMADLGITATTAQWLVSGFTLVNAIVVAISAFLMDKFKMKTLFIAAFIALLAGSLLAAWGATFPMLLAGRFMQAMCAGIMMPLSMTGLLLLFPREKRGAAMGVFSFVIMFAPAIGPVISGVLTDQVGWHATFMIMAALTVIIIITAAVAMKNFSDVKGAVLDKVSVLLSTIGLFSLLYGLSMLGHTETILYGAIGMVIGATLLVVFTKRQLTQKQPFLQIGVLAEPQFRIGTVVLMLLSASLTAATITLPLYVQNVRGMSATVSGMIMMPGSIIGAVAGFFSGKLSDKFGPRRLAIIGTVVIIIGSVGMAFWGLDTPLWLIIPVYCLRYLGLMLTNAPINLWSIGKLSNDRLNHGNAVSNTLRQVATSFGTTIMISVMSIAAGLVVAGGDVQPQLFGIRATFWLSVVIAVVCFVLILLRVESGGKNAPAYR